MSRVFKLPDLGEGIHEGEVLKVLVVAGQKVKEGDPLLEVETDKAAVEIPSPFTGTVEEIRVRPGEVVTVGQVLVVFDGREKGETLATPAGKQAPPGITPATPATAESAPGGSAPVPAAPTTRRLARELGVDLHKVPPSGPQGLVTAEDVRRFAAGVAAVPAQPPSPAASTGESAPLAARPLTPGAGVLPDFSRWGTVERQPVRSIRRATALQVAQAWSQIPHVNSQDAADVTELEAFRQKHKAQVEAQGGRLTLTVFALKAAVTALKAFPRFNASLDAEAGEIVLKHYFHLGVATDTPEGLLVPVIRDVDRKSITELAVEFSDLVRRARERKLDREALQGGCLTVTNAGALGGGFFSPIILHPQVAILGLGAARLQPMVRSKGRQRPEIVPRLMLPLVLAIDHRVLDGADAVRFLGLAIRCLEDPAEMLMNMI